MIDDSLKYPVEYVTVANGGLVATGYLFFQFVSFGKLMDTFP